MNDLIGVLDQETKAILCFTKTISCANSVCNGFVNGHIFIFPASLPWRKKELDGLDLKGDLSITDGKISKLAEHLITDKYKKQKEVATLRALYINSLEVYMNSQAARVGLFLDDNALPFVLRELQTSIPSDNTYTQGIEEYAAINNITTEAAYQELSLLCDTVGLVKIRNMAWYKRYVDIINTVETREEMKVVFKTLYNEIYGKALI